MHIIAENQKWTHKPSESCRRDQTKNVILSRFKERLANDLLQAPIVLSYVWQRFR